MQSLDLRRFRRLRSGFGLGVPGRVAHGKTLLPPTGWLPELGLGVEQEVEVARTVQHAHDLDPLFGRPVEDQVFFEALDRQRPQSGEIDSTECA